MVDINELTNQCIVALPSGGVQCKSIPLKTIKQSLTLYSVNMTYNLKKSIIQWESVCICICLRPRCGSLSAQCVVLKSLFQNSILHSVLVLHNNNNMASTLDSRLGRLEEQGKTMADATRRLLETVNAVKVTGELLLQMIENHQKMLEMSRRVEKHFNDVKTEVKVETISDEEEDWGDNSPPPPHLILLRIGMRKQMICPSTYQWEGQLRLNSGECDVLHVVVAPVVSLLLKIKSLW